MRWLSALLVLAATAGTAHARPDACRPLPHNPDMRSFSREVDTNRDGRMSRAEWHKAGLPMSSFAMFEKGRGYVTLCDYQTHPAPPGIDLNGDGKVTVAEFREFDRRMSTKAIGMPHSGNNGHGR